MAPDLKMSAMDEARAALRHVDKLDDAFDPIDLRLGARVERDARGAIAIGALFGSKLFEHAGAVDLLVKGDAAAATVGPYDLALQHDTVGQIDVQIFVDMDGNVGRKLHAAIGNIAHAPQPDIIVAHDFCDPPDRPVTVPPTTIAIGRGPGFVRRARKAGFDHSILLIHNAIPMEGNGIELTENIHA